MIGNAEFDQLDKLLEDPALIADRGFSQRVQRRINQPAWSREMVFIALGCVWLTLAASSWSPEFIVTSAGALLDVLAWIGSGISGNFSLFMTQAQLGPGSVPGVMVLLPVLGLAVFQIIGRLEI